MKYASHIFSCVVLAPLLLLLLSHCKEEPLAFYKDPMHGHDVWRLPIINPHELITADCFNGCRGWSYQMGVNFNPDSINFQKGYISFHSDFGNSFGFLNIKTNKLARSLNHQQFTDSLKTFGVGPQLFHTTSVYDCWRASGQLPWAAEILATQEYELIKK